MKAIASEDWVELHQLVTCYSRALDTRDYELLLTIWADDPNISYDLSNVGVEREALTYHSASEMAEDAKVIHAPLLATMHRNSNHWFEVSGDTATGRIYVDLFEVRLDHGDPETVHHMGWYDDTYERDEGKWKIKTRHFQIKWSEGNWIGGTPIAQAKA